MTFGDNPYIPPPNLSIKNDLITHFSYNPSNQMNFHSNSSAENFNSVDTLDPLYQFQGQSNDNKTTFMDYQNIEIKQSKNNKFNSHANEINVPEERYKENILNELGSNEEKGYSFNQMNNKIVSIDNRLEEKIIKQDNLNEWFRKAVGELGNTTKEMGKIFKEMEKLHKE